MPGPDDPPRYRSGVNASVWAAWAGAAVSALGAVTVLWVRWRDRPQVTWHFGADGLVGSLAKLAQFERDGHAPHRVLRLTNVGDGAAYAVTVAGNENTDARIFELNSKDARGFSTASVVGRVASNDFFLVLTWVRSGEPTGPGRPRVLTGDAEVRVRWTEGPVRHQRHREQTLVLLGQEPGPRPVVRLAVRTEDGLTPSRRRRGGLSP